MNLFLDWRVLAALSAIFAAATAILGKLGVEGVPSNLATAIRTAFVLVLAWGISLARGEGQALAKIAPRTVVFLALSALTTGLSWLAYYRALQLGPAGPVAAVDKMSLAVTVILAAIVLHEPLTLKVLGGAALMTVGVILMIRR